MRRPDLTLVVFVAVVLAGGLNTVAVRFSNEELAPFWGAALRLLAGAALLSAFVLARRIRLPRGRASVGVLLYGVLGFAAFFGFLYWGLTDAPAGAGALAVALVPLITLVLAPLHGLERFRGQAVIGAVVSVAGMGVVFADQLGARVAPVSLVALLLGAIALSEGTVIVKAFPRSDAAATNAIGLAVGGTLLLVLSFAIGEQRALPLRAETLLALGYLVVVGSVLLFMGFLYVLARWTASAASYQLLFMPLVTLPAASFLRGEPVSEAFAAGGALVLAGVYLGAIAAPLPLIGQAPPVTHLAPAAGPPVGGQNGAGFLPPNCP